MINENIIRELVEKIIRDDDVFLVDVKVTTANKITIHVDNNEGIRVDKCAKINRSIEGMLDREQEDYELVVSSPGLGTPLKVMEQYIKNIGRELELVMNDNISLSGKLSSVNEKDIIIETEKKGSKEIVSHELVLDEIKTAKVKIVF